MGSVALPVRTIGPPGSLGTHLSWRSQGAAASRAVCEPSGPMFTRPVGAAVEPSDAVLTGGVCGAAAESRSPAKTDAITRRTSARGSTRASRSGGWRSGSAGSSWPGRATGHRPVPGRMKESVTDVHEEEGEAPASRGGPVRQDVDQHRYAGGCRNVGPVGCRHVADEPRLFPAAESLGGHGASSAGCTASAVGRAGIGPHAHLYLGAARANVTPHIMWSTSQLLSHRRVESWQS